MLLKPIHPKGPKMFLANTEFVDAGVASFRVAIEDRGDVTRYAKDAGHVWYIGAEYYGEDPHLAVADIIEIDGADAASFKHSPPLRYRQRGIKAAEDIESLYMSYAIDKRAAHYQECPIAGSFPSSFSVIFDESGGLRGLHGTGC